MVMEQLREVDRALEVGAITADEALIARLILTVRQNPHLDVQALESRIDQAQTEWERTTAKRQCVAIKADQQRCQRNALAASNRCGIHNG